jgi:hypothetical protein
MPLVFLVLENAKDYFINKLAIDSATPAIGMLLAPPVNS